MLTLRERILVLFATAPTGFGATKLELRRKFGAGKEIYPILASLQRKGVLDRDMGTQQFVAGYALLEEVGGV